MGREQFPGVCQKHGIEAKPKTTLYFVSVDPHSSTTYWASLVEFPFQSTPVCLNGIGVPSGAFVFNKSAYGNPLLGAVWGDRAAGPFNFMHSGYGVGAALAPLILAPFTFDANFTVPNSISGLFFAVLHCTQRCERPTPVTRPSSSGHTGAGDAAEAVSLNDPPLSTSFGSRLRRSFDFILAQRASFVLIPSIFALYFALVGNERVFSKYAFVAAVYGPARLTSRDSYLLVTSYWISFSMARVTTFLVSLLVPIRWLFLLQLVGTWGMSLGLVFAPPDRPYIFALTVLFGLFKSPLFPSGLSVINEAAEVSGFIVFFVNLGSSIGASCMQYLASYLIHIYSPDVFPMIVMVTALVLLVIGISLLVVVRIVRRRNGRASLTVLEPDNTLEPEL
nr:unnamed protein product [Spirometra erinaceieuropaei]